MRRDRWGIENELYYHRHRDTNLCEDQTWVSRATQVETGTVLDNFIIGLDAT